MGVELLLETALIKKIARNQAAVDTDFAKQVVELRMKLLQKKITGEKFWEEYKKALLKSAEKNKKTLQELFQKTDKTITQQFKQAQEQEKQQPEKTIDLSLPK
jgi:ribosomal protein S17E